MRYYMFIDESGEANVKKPDPRFDIFVLCGVVFREDHYAHFDNEFKELKKEFFGHDGIIFHSVEMRSKKGVFKLFLQQEVLNTFYKRIGEIFTNCSYNIISCVVNKEKYRRVYPYKNYAYE